MDRQDIVQIIKESIASEIDLKISSIAENEEFFNLGVNSMQAIFILEKLESALQISLDPILLWDYPTVNTLASYIENEIGNEQ